MLRSSYLSCVRSRCVRWCGVLAAMASLGLASCTNLTTYREDGFSDIEPSDYIRQVDPVDRNSGYFGVSEKAQEIDRNLGPGL